MSAKTISHQFDIDVATDVGVNASIIFCSIRYWIEKNEANKKNYHDDRYWTYNSISAYAQLFPYLTEGQIRCAIKRLIEGGYIIKDCHSKKDMNRTSWYALGRKYIPSNDNDIECDIEQTHLHCRTNASALQNKSIYKDTSNKLTSNKLTPHTPQEGGNLDREISNPFLNKEKIIETTQKETAGALTLGHPPPKKKRKPVDSEPSEQFLVFWNLYPRKDARKGAWTAWKRGKFEGGKGEDVIAKLKMQTSNDHRYTKENKYLVHGSTYLNGERFNDPIETGAQHENSSTGNAGAGAAIKETELERIQRELSEDFASTYEE